MRSDRELLELAAKAAGYREFQHCEGSGGLRAIYIHDADIGFWIPLIDYGDVLQLAVQLRLDLSFVDNRVEVSRYDRVKDTTLLVDEVIDDTQDEREATCRAIVRAAAEIGAQAHPDHKDGGTNGV